MDQASGRAARPATPRYPDSASLLPPARRGIEAIRANPCTTGKYPARIPRRPAREHALVGVDGVVAICLATPSGDALLGRSLPGSAATNGDSSLRGRSSRAARVRDERCRRRRGRRIETSGHRGDFVCDRTSPIVSPAISAHMGNAMTRGGGYVDFHRRRVYPKSRYQSDYWWRAHSMTDLQLRTCLSTKSVEDWRTVR